jgi:predicted alpha/beta-fold hydrolase
VHPQDMNFGGHFWTIAPNLRHRLLPAPAPASTPWSTTVDDPRLGPITLRGALRHQPEGASLVLLVHGLGGTIESHYMIRAARAAAKRGLGSLRLALRGADRSGEDLYHAGLTADLAAALASPALAHYRRLYVAGFSLGGHVTLRLALAPPDRRLRAVASLCAPLDLAASCAAIDRPQARLYRRHVLTSLQEIYSHVAQRGRAPAPLAQLAAITTIREWDRYAVVPRFGFASVDDYHAEMSAGPRLGELVLPALIAAAERDPMIPAATVRPALSALVGAGAKKRDLEIRWLADAGHLGAPAAERLYDDVFAWLAAR